jgi:GTP cyclohydrolase I
MYAIEFETVIKNKYIELQNVDDLINKQVRVIVLVEENKLSLKSTEDKVVDERMKNVFADAVDLIIDKDIEIDSLCNEVTG